MISIDIIDNIEKHAMFSFPNRIALLVPSTINTNQHIDNSEQVEKSKLLFIRLFGGVTIRIEEGGYVLNDGGSVFEEVTKIISYCDDDTLKSCINIVLSHALSLKTEMSQESIGIQINEVLYLI